MWEKKPLYDRIIDRLDQVKTRYQRFNSARDTIVDYFRPDLGIETDESKDGEFFGENIYEGSGPWAARTMAVGFQGNLVSKSVDWLSYKMKQFELRGIDPLDIWLQDVKEYMTDVYQRSTFYDEQPQFTLDALTIGSPVMFGDEDIVNETIIWTPQHYKHCFLYYDRANRVEGIIIKDPTWTAKKIDDKFITARTPKEKEAQRKEKFSNTLNDAIRSGRANQEFTIYRAVFKSTDPIWDREGYKKPAGEGKTWYSVYFEEIGPDQRKDKPLENEGYFSQPFVVWDYDKKRWESASRTPAFDAVWDNQSLQEAHKQYLENNQLKNRPPRSILNEMRGRTRFTPEGEIYYERDEQQYLPKAIDVIGDITFSPELSNLFSEKLYRHFHLDLFRMFSSEALLQKQPLTATQIWQMAGEKSTLLSPAVESHSRYLTDVDNRMIDIESRAGRGPFAPDVLANIIDVVLNNAKRPIRSIGLILEAVGPLARAQKIQQAVAPIINGLQTVAPVFELFPETKYVIKEYELVDEMFAATNFPQDVIRTKEDYDNIVAGVRQQLADDERFAKAIEMAKASKDVSGSVEPDSVLGAVAGAT